MSTATKKIVLRVCINCQKCKKQVLKAVTKLEGIDSVAVDGEKWTLTVIGVVDPVCVAKRIRKIGKTAEILTVGPPKPASPKPETVKPFLIAVKIANSSLCFLTKMDFAQSSS